MNSIKLLILIMCSIAFLISCTDEKIIVQPSIEFVETCQAEFIDDIFFTYTNTYFFNGDVFVTCEVSDVLLAKSTSSSRFYSKNDLTVESQRLECALFYDVSPSIAGEFIFNIVNGTPGMTQVNFVNDTETDRPYLPGDCFTQTF